MTASLSLLRFDLRHALVALALVTLAGWAGMMMRRPHPRPRSPASPTADDAPGSKPDPVETPQATEDFDEFIKALRRLRNRSRHEEMTAVFEEAGFERARMETRLDGETHSRPHVMSKFGHSASVRRWGDERPRLARNGRQEAMPHELRRKKERVRGVTFRRAGHPPKRNRPGHGEGRHRQRRPFDSYWVGFTEVHMSTRWICIDLQGPYRRSRR